MYMTDVTHFLDDKGGRKMADFLGSVIVAATQPDPVDHCPKSIKCAGAVKPKVGATGAIEWQ